MKVLCLLLLSLMFTGCASLYKGEWTETEQGIKFKSTRACKAEYKNVDVTASVDFKGANLFEDVAKLYTVKKLEED